MAVILQTTFSNSLDKSFCTMIQIFLQLVPRSIISKQSNNGSDNSLAPSWRQAIIWTNENEYENVIC